MTVTLGRGPRGRVASGRQTVMAGGCHRQGGPVLGLRRRGRGPFCPNGTSNGTYDQNRFAFDPRFFRPESVIMAENRTHGAARELNHMLSNPLVAGSNPARGTDDSQGGRVV